MKTDKRKVALVGCGMVGMSYAYAMLNQNVCDELVLIDVDKKRAEGEAMDMNHGLAFSGSNMKIFAGSYDDCGDADIVCICAGVAQKPGETRLDLLQRNAAVFKSIIDPVTESGFNGLFLVATNPVDIMTRITCALSGFNPRRVLGTGTALDTARLRYLLGDYFHVDPRNMHAYVMGEHGDSEFVPWSQAMLATKPVLELCRQSGGRYCSEELDKIAEEVRTAAYKIIEAKRATYYGIGAYTHHAGGVRQRKQRTDGIRHAAGRIRPERRICWRTLHCEPQRHPACAGAEPLRGGAGTVQRFLRDAAGELCRTEAINRRKEKEADGSVPSASFLYVENHSLGEWFKRRLMSIMGKEKLPLLYWKCGLRTAQASKGRSFENERRK